MYETGQVVIWGNTGGQSGHTTVYTGNQTQTPVRVNTLPNGTPQISVGGTTLDKLLQALSTNLAIIKGAGYIPTTQQPVQQPLYYPQQQTIPVGDGSTGANFGAGIEQFVTQNTGLLLIGGIAFLLFKSGRK